MFPAGSSDDASPGSRGGGDGVLRGQGRMACSGGRGGGVLRGQGRRRAPGAGAAACSGGRGGGVLRGQGRRRARGSGAGLLVGAAAVRCWRVRGCGADRKPGVFAQLARPDRATRDFMVSATRLHGFRDHKADKPGRRGRRNHEVCPSEGCSRFAIARSSIPAVGRPGGSPRLATSRPAASPRDRFPGFGDRKAGKLGLKIAQNREESPTGPFTAGNGPAGVRRCAAPAQRRPCPAPPLRCVALWCVAPAVRRPCGASPLGCAALPGALLSPVRRSPRCAALPGAPSLAARRRAAPRVAAVHPHVTAASAHRVEPQADRVLAACGQADIAGHVRAGTRPGRSRRRAPPGRRGAPSATRCPRRWCRSRRRSGVGLPAAADVRVS